MFYIHTYIHTYIRTLTNIHTHTRYGTGKNQGGRDALASFHVPKGTIRVPGMYACDEGLLYIVSPSAISFDTTPLLCMYVCMMSE